EREAMQALIDAAQNNVSGTARLKLYKGSAAIAGRRAENSLYDPRLASFEEAGGYQQADAEGFIRLGGLRLRALARIDARRRGKA
ncbi:MAG: argininosuccinate synthase, partial [Candidatus Binataceae bacterium]